jgi:cyclopropane fatty-acyl-phospholipid synthase-like methyltransferase
MKDNAAPDSSDVEAFETPIYASVTSPQAQEILDLHYDTGGGLYKMWASPVSVCRAILFGWVRSGHPAQLHYGWNLEQAVSLDEAIHETTRQAVDLLQLAHVAAPRIFEPGCGIGGAVTAVAQRFPNATVVGMSLVASQIGTARSRASAIGLGNTEFHVGNYLSTGFDADSVDGIYAIEALCYTPETERLALFTELYRILKPGGHLVVLDGVSLRAARNEEERGYIADVLAGWTVPMPCSVSDFAGFARMAGFSVLRQEDITAHVIGSARRIKNIARYLLQPLAFLARLPGLSNLLRPLGFGSALHARRFVNACLSQQQVFDHGLGAYYVHLLRKPSDTAAH